MSGNQAHIAAAHAAASARGWNDIYDIWCYVSTDFRWVVVVLAVWLVVAFTGAAGATSREAHRRWHREDKTL